jgi:hypothetical protein
MPARALTWLLGERKAHDGYRRAPPSYFVQGTRIHTVVRDTARRRLLLCRRAAADGRKGGAPPDYVPAKLARLAFRRASPLPHCYTGATNVDDTMRSLVALSDVTPRLSTAIPRSLVAPSSHLADLSTQLLRSVVAPGAEFGGVRSTYPTEYGGTY